MEKSFNIILKSQNLQCVVDDNIITVTITDDGEWSYYKCFDRCFAFISSSLYPLQRTVMTMFSPQNPSPRRIFIAIKKISDSVPTSETAYAYPINV